MDVSAEHLALIRRCLAEHVAGLEVRAFGSRVVGNAKPWSDLDLAVVAPTPLDLRTLADLREAFRESDLPFRVDVVELHNLPDALQRMVCTKGELVQPAEQVREDEGPTRRTDP